MSDARAPKIWTLAEANAVVPRLEVLVGQQMQRAGDIDGLLSKLQRLDPSAVEPARRSPAQSRPPGFTLDIKEGDAVALREMKLDLVARIRAYEEGWARIQELGAVVKDPRSGLCDFYGRVEGKLVWLCWRYGEPAIEHYHDLDAGFSGRKALTATTKKRLLN